MNMAPQELEKSASQYATAAIKHDAQGARGMAITNYQKAAETLLKLMRLYPDSQLNKIYTERMKSYQNRIKSLQSTSLTDAEPVVDDKIHFINQLVGHRNLKLEYHLIEPTKNIATEHLSSKNKTSASRDSSGFV